MPTDLEPVSKISEHHVPVCEMDKAEEVFDVIFPSSYETTEGMYPGKEPFHLPSSAIGSGGGRPGKEGACPAVHATALRYPAPKAHHSTPHACYSTGGHDYLLAEPNQHRLDDQPLFIGQLPASGHALVRGVSQSNNRMNQFRPSKVYETGSSQSCK